MHKCNAGTICKSFDDLKFKWLQITVKKHMYFGVHGAINFSSILWIDCFINVKHQTAWKLVKIEIRVTLIVI